jgi:hypothetical protein
MLASFSEGLLLGEAAGLDPETILEVTNFCDPETILEGTNFCDPETNLDVTNFCHFSENLTSKLAAGAVSTLKCIDATVCSITFGNKRKPQVPLLLTHKTRSSF